MGEESSMDHSFLTKVNETIEKNFDNEGFGVDELALEIGVSRSQLHRKLQIINQHSASQLIKAYRLQKAHELLQKKGVTVSEISYQVGFGSPSYFNTCFHEYFGYSPGKVKLKKPSKSKRLVLNFNKSTSKVLISFLAILIIAFSIRAFVSNSGIKYDKGNEPMTIVVLPFQNFNNDLENQYFVDGMTETLINYLAKIKSLKVISRTTSMTYKNTDKTIPEIARELGTDVVVEGSVMRSQGRVRITAQLINGKEDEHLWSNQYDHNLSDVLKIHRDVSKEIVHLIQISLSPSEEKIIDKAPVVNPAAFEAYLMGRYHLYRLTPDHYEQAFNYFQKALEIDPEYSPAHAGLALVWNHRGLWSGYKPREVAAHSKEFAHNALSIDPDNGEAHQALAGVYSLYEWHWEKAIMEYEKVIQLAPNLTEARLLYGDMLLSLGDSVRAFDHITKAIALDPLNPFSYSILGWGLYADQQYEEAIEELLKSIEMDPSMSLSLRCLWSSHHKLGNHKESLIYAKLFFKAQGLTQVEQYLDEGFTQGGYHHAMAYAASKLEEFSQYTFIPAMRIARLYAQGGEVDKAVQLLQKSYQERFPSMMSINVDPDWEPLFGNNDFQILLEKMNFPEPKIP